eukprot:1053027-Heterocapsa_arctica.AAC.1
MRPAPVPPRMVQAVAPPTPVQGYVVAGNPTIPTADPMAWPRPVQHTDGLQKTEHSSQVRAQSASGPVRDSFRPQPAASPRIL